jgi:hypothetical protein
MTGTGNRIISDTLSMRISNEVIVTVINPQD